MCDLRHKEAEDSERPLCKCHDEPMAKDGFFRDKQKWQCRIRERARQARLYRDPEFAERKRQEMRGIYDNIDGAAKKRARYWERKRRGVCVRCQGPLLSEVYCWDCLNDIEEQHTLGPRRKRGVPSRQSATM